MGTVKYYVPIKNPEFVGREPYWQRLQEIDADKSASIIVVYGRRRVGKTELIEQFFRGRPMLKFEGLEPNAPDVRRGSPVERRRQINECVKRLGLYVGRRGKHATEPLETWSDFFRLLLPFLVDKAMVLYLDEIQWLANYSNELLGELKPFWDDVLRHNPRLRIMLSSSSSSFIVGQFSSASALYNRSSHMMKLEPFDLNEARQLLGKGSRETMLAAIAVGGIPEHLKQIKSSTSVFIGLCEKSFRPGAFFRLEKDQVFVSSMRGSRFYEGIVDHLARHGPATRSQLYQALTGGDEHDTPGGSFSRILEELVELDLVERQVPITVRSRNPARSRHARYSLADEYLHFYYSLIESRKKDIDTGKYARDPVKAVSRANFSKLMGFSFERWCRKNEQLIARHLRFGGVVEYIYGPWFEQGVAQIDLMFIRKDAKLIICEVKYNIDTRLTPDVILDVQEKVDAFLARHPRYASYTPETALITMEPIPQALKNEAYFTYLITCDDLMATAARPDP